MSQFESVVATYLEKVDLGQQVDPEQFMREHPVHAERLGRFFSNVGAFKAVVDPIQEALIESEPFQGKLGDFRVLNEVGRGGMGIVYEAYDKTVGRKIALKVLPASAAVHENLRTRFENEIYAVAQLNHDHIVPIYSVGEDKGTHFFAMKLIDGVSLADVLNVGHPSQPFAERLQLGIAAKSSTTISAPDPREVATRIDGFDEQAPMSSPTSSGATSNAKYSELAKVIANVALALNHAHCKGIVHRDIKPSNLLIDESGKVWVSDFGLARIEHQQTVTAENDVLGTVQYMGPEQAVGSHDIDGRADIYSLGVILFQLLTGELPFRGTRRMLLHRVVHDDPPEPRSLNPQIPRDIATICMKCLEKKPGQRYATAQHLADDLDRFINKRPIHARPTGLVERSIKTCMRHRTWAAAAAVGGIAAIVVVSLSLGYARREGKLNEQLAVTLSGSEQLRQQADDARELALERAEQLRRQAYSRDMQRAYQMWIDGWISEVHSLLKAQVPSEGQTDYRDASWHILCNAAHHEPPTELFGHEGPANDIAVFDSGRRCVTVGRDAVIRIWDVESQTLEFTLRDERATSSVPNAVASVLNRLTPKGKTLPTSQATPEYLSVAVSPDGKQLVTGKFVLTLWDLESRKRIRDLAVFPTRISSIAFSPNGKQVAAHSFDQCLKVISLDDQSINQIKTGLGLGRFAYLAKGTQLAVPYNLGKDDRGLWILNASNCEIIRDIPMPGHRIINIEATNDGSYLFVAKHENNQLLVETATGLTKAISPSFRAKLVDSALSPDQRTLLTAYEDGSVTCQKLPADWRAKPASVFESKPMQIAAHEAGCNAIRFTQNGDFATAGSDGKVKLWNASAETSRIAVKEDLTGVFELCGGELFCGSRSGISQVALAKEPTSLSRNATPLVSWCKVRNETAVSSISIADNASVAAFGTWDGRVGLFDLKRQKLRFQLKQHDIRSSEITSVALSPDGLLLANGSRDHTIRIRSVTTGRELHRIKTKGWGMAAEFSPNGEKLVCADSDGHLYLYDTENWTELARLRATSGINGCSCIGFESNERFFSGHKDAQVYVWDIQNLSLVKKLRGHMGPVTCVALHPDNYTWQRQAKTGR